LSGTGILPAFFQTLALTQVPHKRYTYLEIVLKLILSPAILFEFSAHLRGLSVNIVKTGGPTGGFQTAQRFLGLVPLAEVDLCAGQL
jgi:hypothetical protein